MYRSLSQGRGSLWVEPWQSIGRQWLNPLSYSPLCQKIGSVWNPSPFGNKILLKLWGSGLYPPSLKMTWPLFRGSWDLLADAQSLDHRWALDLGGMAKIRLPSSPMDEGHRCWFCPISCCSFLLSFTTKMQRYLNCFLVSQRKGSNLLFLR